MKFLLVTTLFFISMQASASCKYEARIRLGLVWHTVHIKSEKPLTRKQVINRLSQKYNFHDVGNIHEYQGCNG